MNEKSDPLLKGPAPRHANGNSAVGAVPDQRTDQQQPAIGFSSEKLAAELESCRSKMRSLELKCDKFEKQNEMLSAALAKNLRVPSGDLIEMRRKDAFINRSQNDMDFLIGMIGIIYRHPLFKYSVISHYFVNVIKRVSKKKGLFDTDDYLSRYPDVRNAEFEPIFHFALHGIKEGRVK